MLPDEHGRAFSLPRTAYAAMICLTGLALLSAAWPTLFYVISWLGDYHGARGRVELTWVFVASFVVFVGGPCVIGGASWSLFGTEEPRSLTKLILLSGLTAVVLISAISLLPR